MGLSAQQLSQPLRLGHLRGDTRRLLRCLERPHGQILGHRLNWNQRLGTGQDLGRLVLLPAPYFHVVYTLPGPIADIAYQNKAVIYDILFKASAETMITIAADPKHLGARIGITSVLHTWGSAMTHHPHVHMIVPGGGLSED